MPRLNPWPNHGVPGPAGSKLWKKTLKRQFGKEWRWHALFAAGVIQ